VNPHIQSPVQKNGEQIPQLHELTQNGLSNDQIHSQIHENDFISDMNTNEKYPNHHHYHHHIQVEPKTRFKRTSSPIKHQQIVDVQPNIIVQHQRSTLGTNSTTNIVHSSTQDPLNEAYIERTNSGVNTYTNNNNDSSSTLKQYESQQERKKNSLTPPPSPVTQELNRFWKKQRNRYSTRSMTANLADRKTSKTHRPPGRLKNYEDESNSETTATETQSKDEGI